MPVYTVNEVMSRVEALSGKVFSPSGIGAWTETLAFQTLKDAYDQVTGALRFPRKIGYVTPQSNIRKYPVPDDCWDGYKGIDRMVFNGQTVFPLPLQEVIDRFGFLINCPWDGENPETPSVFNPSNVHGICFWFNEDGARSFSVLRTPTKDDCKPNNKFTLFYVQTFLKPVARIDQFPDAFEPLLGPITKFLQGTCLDAEKNGRGSALIAEFNAYLMKQQGRQKRGMRRQTPEGYTMSMDNYVQNYRGYSPLPWR